jgi:CHAT domain-containing protein
VNGDYVEAEKQLRASIKAMESYRDWKLWAQITMQLLAKNYEFQHVRLSLNLARQGRLAEAEAVARTAFQLALKSHGRLTVHTLTILQNISAIMLAQGRFEDATGLVKSVLVNLEKMGVAENSLVVIQSKLALADALVLTGKSKEALDSYSQVAGSLADNPEVLNRLVSGKPGYGLALARANQQATAKKVFETALKQREELFGKDHHSTLLMAALVAGSDDGDAAAEAVESLLKKSQTLTKAMSNAGDAAEIRLSIEQIANGLTAPDQIFPLVEIIRASTVQQALAASGARAAAGDEKLAELIRKEQDLEKRVDAVFSLIATLLTAPAEAQDTGRINGLKEQAAALQKQRADLAGEVFDQFPQYANLSNPKPSTVADAQKVMTEGEVLVSIYATTDGVHVIAVPRSGAAKYHKTPLPLAKLQSDVAKLRRALDPAAESLSDIPPFDVVLAQDLYSKLLGPVADVLKPAKNILVVANQPLSQLPFGVLVTRPATAVQDGAPPFDGYQKVPWLTRTHAVTVLPSVAALVSLRATEKGSADRAAFAGFGDPLFSAAQADAKTADAGAVVSVRGRPIKLRSAAQFRGTPNAELGLLPRLPDTGDEINSIANVVKADADRDIYLTERATEENVRKAELGAYKVVAFATHGLVPGDLNGLHQPALALTSPAIDKTEGDGLLTMGEVLGLRLNADWVVLSACNTGAGDGAGAEAFSGLGRAFFYAGTRAVLLSNWPVETTSARLLTTDLFRRQAADANLGRAAALQQSMAALIDSEGFKDPGSGQVLFSYAHPIFWAPFTIVGDGGA